MTTRKAAILDYLTAKDAESMQILAALAETDWDVPVHAEEAAGGQWTVRDILAHLADAERGQLGQIERLVAGGQTVPPNFDVHRWNRRVVAKRAGQPPLEMLAEIRVSFAALVQLLETLADEDLDRVGRHARGDDLSVAAYFRRIAAHRAEHAAEVRAALGR